MPRKGSRFKGWVRRRRPLVTQYYPDGPVARSQEQQALSAQEVQDRLGALRHEQLKGQRNLLLS